MYALFYSYASGWAMSRVPASLLTASIHASCAPSPILAQLMVPVLPPCTPVPLAYMPLTLGLGEKGTYLAYCAVNTSLSAAHDKVAGGQNKKDDGTTGRHQRGNANARACRRRACLLRRHIFHL